MRFSLRALMIAVTVLCVLFGAVMLWYGAQVAEHHRQAELADRLKQLGAEISWEDQTPGFLKWIGSWECYSRIEAVAFFPQSDADAVFRELSKLPNLKGICVQGKMLNVDFLNRLRAIKGLKTLTIAARDMADQESMSSKEIQRILPNVDAGVMWVD